MSTCLSAARPERRHARQVRRGAAWASFARSGDPSVPGLPDWPAYGVPGRATMIFNDECRVEDDPDSKLRAMLA